MIKNVANLIQIVNKKNKFGELEEEQIKREVFVDEKSVGMKEVYEAHAYGLKPSIVFVLADYFEYDNEEFIEYDNKIYKIIRSYKRNNNTQIELVCEHSLNNGEIHNANT